MNYPSLIRLVPSNEPTTEYQTLFRETIEHVKTGPDQYIHRNQFLFYLGEETVYGQLNVHKAYDALLFHFLFRTHEFPAPVPDRPALLLSNSNENLVGLSFIISNDDGKKVNEIVGLFEKLLESTISQKVESLKSVVESLEALNPSCPANPQATRAQPPRNARNYSICNTPFKLEPTFHGMRICSSTRFYRYDNYRISWKTETTQSDLIYLLAAKLMVASEESLPLTPE